MLKTRAHASKAVAKHRASGLEIEIDSNTVTVWRGEADFDAPRAVAEEIAKDLNASYISHTGYKSTVYYKQPPSKPANWPNE